MSAAPLGGAAIYSAFAIPRSALGLGVGRGEVRTRRHSLFFSSNPKPGPGPEVFVAARDPGEGKTDYVALAGAIAQILASTVAIVMVATR